MTGTADLKSIFAHDEKFKGLMSRLFEIALTHSFDAMMITENKPEYPIVFVNHAFTRMTGYRNEELVGRSPSVLQGPKPTGRCSTACGKISPPANCSTELQSTTARTGPSF